MSKQTGHHPGQGCSSQGECVAVNRLRTIPTIHQSEYLRHPPPNIPKQSSSAVFSRLGIPPKIHTSVLSFFCMTTRKRMLLKFFSINVVDWRLIEEVENACRKENVSYYWIVCIWITTNFCCHWWPDLKEESSVVADLLTSVSVHFNTVVVHRACVLPVYLDFPFVPRLQMLGNLHQAKSRWAFPGVVQYKYNLQIQIQIQNTKSKSSRRFQNWIIPDDLKLSIWFQYCLDISR